MTSSSVPHFQADFSKGNILCDWSQLPDDLFASISKTFGSMNDYVRFGAVCASWQTITASNRDRQFPHQVPYLMVQNMHGNSTRRSLYNICNKAIYSPQVDVAHDHCASSTHGWLVTLDTEFKVELVNPFLSIKNSIKLPPLTYFYQGEPAEELHSDGYLKRAILSANPTSTSNYVVMTIYGSQNKLAFCKPGDENWTNVVHEHNNFSDLVYFKDEFYAVDGEGKVIALACDTKGHSQPKVRNVAPPPTDLHYQKNYIVKSQGQLLQVKRILDFEFDGYSSIYNTVAFKVFKLNDQVSPVKWVEMKSLCDWTLFLGDNASFSVSSSDFLQCQPNSIYFTDDARDLYGIMGPQDMGVFSLEGGIVEQNPLIEFKGLMPPPIWVEPTLQHCRTSQLV